MESESQVKPKFVRPSLSHNFQDFSISYGLLPYGMIQTESCGTWTPGMGIFNTLPWGCWKTFSLSPKASRAQRGRSFLQRRMQPPHSGLEELGVTLRFCDLRAARLPAGCPRAPNHPCRNRPCRAQREPAPGGHLPPQPTFPQRNYCLN